MTQSIERPTAHDVRTYLEERGRSGRRKMPTTALKVGTGVFAFAGVALFTAAAMGGEHALYFVVAGGTTAVLSGIGGAMIFLHASLTSRQEFYRRGHLDGWMRGWRGQPPESDAPGLE